MYFDFDQARKFLRKRIVSSDGQMIRRISRVPGTPASLEPATERSQQIELFNKLKEDWAQPLVQEYQPRRLTISLEL